MFQYVESGFRPTSFTMHFTVFRQQCSTKPQYALSLCANNSSHLMSLICRSSSSSQPRNNNSLSSNCLYCSFSSRSCALSALQVGVYSINHSPTMLCSSISCEKQILFPCSSTSNICSVDHQQVNNRALRFALLLCTCHSSDLRLI